jgi:hypothetical protein
MSQSGTGFAPRPTPPSTERKETEMAERLDKKQINDELEQLQLEESRERVAQIRRLHAARENRMRTRQTALEKNNAIQKASEEGGKGKEMWFSGNDHNHSVVKHILSHGPMIVLCQRCSKLWQPPPIELRSGNAEERREYKRLYAEYQAAVNLPTDNETSGARLFEFTQQVA